MSKAIWKSKEHSLNANTLPASFWLIYEALRSPNLRARLLAERQTCYKPDSGELDIAKLCSAPLHQSAYAEVLRLRVAVPSLRMSETESFSLGDYTVPKDTTLVILSNITARNHTAWASARPCTVSKPLDQFWAERFLVPSDDDPEKMPEKFSLDGLQACWMPYGGGQLICPGRHLAKNEIIGALAVIMEAFEVEFTDLRRAECVGVNLDGVPSGALPPTTGVPVKIRRRV